MVKECLTDRLLRTEYTNESESYGMTDMDQEATRWLI